MPDWSRPILSFAVAVLAAALYWSWQGRAVDIVELPDGRFQCLSYSPYDGGPSPLDGDRFDVPLTVVERDVEVLKEATDCLRTYAAVGVQGEVTRIAHERGMRVYQGIWISGEPEDSRKEMNAGIELALRYPETVKGIFVGNEVLLRREMTGAMLAALIDEVKAATGKPVLYADVPHFWIRYPEVARAVDVIGVHILPYWDDPEPVSIDEVQAHVDAILAMMRVAFPDKPMMIGEIGWPSAGRTRGAAVPSLVNQARFVREFAARATAAGIDYNLIEAIDLSWKQVPEGTVGGHWGILDKDRVLKFPLSGPVREWPNWLRALGATLLIMGAFLAWGLWAGRLTMFTGWSALAALSLATGISLVHHVEMTAVISLTPIGWAMGAGVGLLTLGAVALLVASIEGRIAPAAAPPADVLGALRGRLDWNVARAIGAYYWLAAVPVAILALAIGFDGRHRDMMIWGLWLPGLALALLARGGGSAGGRPWRETAWLTLVLIVGGALAFDGWRNVEAFLWMATVLLFAVPGRHALAAELRYLRSGPVERRGPQQGQNHGDGG